MSQVFAFQSTPVRTRIEKENVWFVAKDICAVLGISWSGATMKSIPEQWRTMLSFNIVGKNRRVSCISEPAVYKLAFRSNKPEADAFTNWVASEVLPTIRKTGKYEAAPKAEQLALPDVTFDTTVRREAELMKQHLYAAGASSRKLYAMMNSDAATMGLGRPGRTPEKFGLMDNLHRANETAFYALDNIAETIERNVRAMRRLALA